MVVDQAAAAEGLCDELALQPVRIDPEFVCSIHDRYPFLRTYVLPSVGIIPQGEREVYCLIVFLCLF